MLIVMCPNCGNKQLCNPRSFKLKEKSKNCVYCGKQFKIITKKTNMNRIVKILN